jgi:hypothetical protein
MVVPLGMRMDVSVRMNMGNFMGEKMRGKIGTEEPFMFMP